MSTYHDPVAREETPDVAEARIPVLAEAVVDLLNSRPHATPVMPDTLVDPETARSVLSAFGSPEEGLPSEGRLEQIRALRSDLMNVVAPSGPADTALGWAGVTNHASTVGFRQTFSELGEVQPQQVTGDPVVGAVIFSVVELIGANALSRIRVCANEVCRHVFYDTTRSRTQRWHSYEVCGNRTNVAAYRTRKTTSRGAG
jgi:hypothetical protein